MARPRGRAGERVTGSLWDHRARELLRDAASHAPTPGGGSVSALAGAFGFGLVLMALEITARKKNPAPDVADLLGRGRDLLPALTEDADEDVRVFQAYVNALNLPRDTDEHRAAREAAVKRAARRATDAPLHAARRLLGAIRFAADVVPVTHHAVVSDVGAGVAIIAGAAHATLLNVDINAAHLAALDRADALREREALEDDIPREASAVRAAVRARLMK